MSKHCTPENYAVLYAINHSGFDDDHKRDMKRQFFAALKDALDIEQHEHIKILSNGQVLIRAEDGVWA